MNKPDTKAAVLQAEKELHECFRLLMRLKHGDLKNPDSIFQFQPKLADCLYEVMQAYKKIVSAEKELIDRRGSLSKEEFSAQMKTYGIERKALKKIIGIGRAMGDGFAWIFYRNSTEELDKQYGHDDNGLFVSGVGGRGEIEFIRSHQNFKGMFALYHTITSMLRVGDFSLCTIDGRVMGIGELKTERNENGLHINAYISSKIDLDKIQGKEDGTPISEEKGAAAVLDPKRLERQLSAQEKLLRKENQEVVKKERVTGYQYHLIEDALKNKGKTAVSADKALVTTVIREEGDLWDVLMVEQTLPEKHEDDIVAAVKTTMLENSRYNEIRFSELDCKMLPFRKPIIWWELEDEIIERILFGNLHVITIYNMAHLYEMLLERGFTLEEKPDAQGRAYRICKKLEEHIFEFENPEMLFDLLLHDFMTTEEIVDTIDQCSKQNLWSEKEHVKINFSLHQQFFGKPRSES